MKNLLILFAVLGCSLVQAEYIGGRNVVQTLYINNNFDYGEWGPPSLCVNGSFVHAAEVNYQSPNNLDETAINALKLYCSDVVEGHDTGYVTSSFGEKGDWHGMQVCPTDFVTGFRANVLEYQGFTTDDVAVEDIEMLCDVGGDTSIIDVLPGDIPRNKAFSAGEWSGVVTCSIPGTAVCGLKTRYEDGALGDETAIADFVLFCCRRDE